MIFLLPRRPIIMTCLVCTPQAGQCARLGSQRQLVKWHRTWSTCFKPCGSEQRGICIWDTLQTVFFTCFQLNFRAIWV
jgi:hypothetical protein